MVEGVPETLCERHDGKGIKRVPPERHALVAWDGDLREFQAGERLSRRARQGEIFLFAKQFRLHMRDIPARDRKGDLRCTLSVDGTVSEPSVLRAKTTDRPVVNSQEAGQTLQSGVQAALNDVGDQRALTLNDFSEEVAKAVRERLQKSNVGEEWGIRVDEVSLRRTITKEQYVDLVTAEEEFQQKLRRIADDTKISDAAAASRVEMALAEIEADKQERIRNLLTEEEKQKPQVEQINAFLQLYGLPARRSGPSAWWLSPVLKLCVIGIVLVAAWMLREPAFSRMGQFCYDSGWYGPAFHFYSWASNTDLDKLEWHRMVARSAEKGKGGLPAAMLDRYLDLVRKHADSSNHQCDAVLHNYLGNAYLMMEPEDASGKAAAQYEQALDLAPEFAPPLMNLGIIRTRQGEMEQAEQYMRRYLEKCPDDGLGWNNLGWGLLRQERWDGAEEAFRKALRLSPTSAEASRGLGHVHFEHGDEAAALAAYQRALMLHPDQPRVVSSRVELLNWKLWEGKLGDGLVTRGLETPGTVPDDAHAWEQKGRELLKRANELDATEAQEAEWRRRALCFFQQALLLAPERDDVKGIVTQLRTKMDEDERTMSATETD